MFRNIGAKCKVAACMIIVLGTIASVLFFIWLLLLEGLPEACEGLLISCVGAWVSGFVLYALGVTVACLEYVSSMAGGSKGNGIKKKSKYGSTDSAQS